MDDWSSRSFRLIALAAGTLKNFSQMDMDSLTLAEAEAAVLHLSVVGVIVVTNNLREDSKRTIEELQTGQVPCMA